MDKTLRQPQMANRIATFLLLALVPTVITLAETIADFYFFVTPDQDTIFCKIQSEESHTVSICRDFTVVKTWGIVSSYSTTRATQRAKGNLTLPATVNLKHVDINDKVTDKGRYTIVAIESDGLSDCMELNSITLPLSITRIEGGSFKNCTSLETINLPSDLQKIELSFADGCTALSAVNVPSSSSSKFFSVGGALCEKGALVFCPKNKKGSLVLPSTVKEIGEFACLNCGGLTSVTIPGSVKTIGKEAFKGCGTLQSVTLTNGIETISTSAFEECRLLKSATIPGSVKTIGNKAFKKCSGLTSLTLSEGIENIYSEAFAFCSSLTSVVIPNSLTFLQGSSFMGCTSLENIRIGTGLKNLYSYTFYGCENLTTVNCPPTLDSDNDAFLGCDKLSLKR